MLEIVLLTFPFDIGFICPGLLPAWQVICM
jgi:hypothetical protein